MIDVNKYIKWDDLIPFINENSPIKIQQANNHPQHDGLSMVGKKLPVSINNDEFNYLKDFIIKYNLTKGFELATGFGISALAITLGFNKTGGFLWSVDSYEEEIIQKIIINDCSQSYKFTEGFWLADKITRLFKVEQNVIFVSAKFPEECPSALDNKYDFIFFDGPKDDASFIEAFDIIKPCLAEKFAIFVHDTHTYDGSAKKHVNDTLGLDFVNVLPNQFFPLMLISNLIK